MIDIHTHILPGVDDGSKTPEESLQMLKAQAEQGIDHVVLTPHFYANQNSPEIFLQRRAQAYERLKTVLSPELPQVYLGAEVQYFEGICNAENLNRLCLGGERLLLLEMPFHPWTQRMVPDAMELNSRSDMQVILAHIERYFNFAKPEMWDDLRNNGLLMQSNATFFLDHKTQKKALDMYERGLIHFIASDCHNMTVRPPNLKKAYDLIKDNHLNNIP